MQTVLNMQVMDSWFKKVKCTIEGLGIADMQG